MQPTGPSDQIRKAALQQTILRYTATGYRVESMTDYSAALVSGKPVNHVLHLILTLLTCSLWGVVWLFLVITGGEKRSTVVVDEWGTVHTR